MALPPLATVEELGTWLGRDLTSDERAAAVLAAASVAVRSRAGTTWVDAQGQLVAAVPDQIGVVTTMVAGRLWENPTSKSMHTEGPFSARWDATGLLTADEEAMIDAALGTPGPTTGVPGLSSVRVVAPRGASATRSYAYLDLQQFDGDEDGS